MAISVDHEARQREILQKSLSLFADLGYSGVTYRQLAERCGLARTALYRYFPGKREIFDSSLNQLSRELSLAFRQAVADRPGLSAAEKLELVMLQALDMIFDHARLLFAVTEYLIAQRHQDEDVARKVRRHTMAMRRTIIQLLREGVAKGEFKNIRCDFSGDLLFGILESAVLRVAITDTANLESMRSSCRAAIQALKQ